MVCSVAILVHLLPLSIVILDYGLRIGSRLLVLGLLNELGSTCSKHGCSRSALIYVVGLLRLRCLQVILIEELVWDRFVDKASGLTPYVLAAELADHQVDSWLVLLRNIRQISLVHLLEDDVSRRR